MNLVIDAGNSLTKIGVFERELMLDKKVFTSSIEVENFLYAFPVDNIILCSVTHMHEDIFSHAQARREKLVLTHALPIPIMNLYGTPETLGVDRLAAACGAWALYPGEASLVVDIGTCINYEFLNERGGYEGGAISPGIHLRFQSMHEFTQRLPTAEAKPEIPLTGNSTTMCLQSGVMNGIREEIKGISARYIDKHPGIRVILTGGDAHFFEILANPSIFVAPDLVLVGLNSILLHNVNP